MSAKSNRQSAQALFANDRCFSAGDKNQHMKTKGKENHCPVLLAPKGTTPKRDLFRTPTNRIKHEARTPLGTSECFNQVEFETPRTKAGRWSGVSDDHPIRVDEGDGLSVMVAVRVRPFSEREKSQRDVKCVVSMDGNETIVSSKMGQVNRFRYDHCFWSFDKVKGQYSGQETVYDRVGRPLLDSAFEGYNTCMFAYGQTGSGKSYTIMGYNKETGIIPRFCRELFRRVDAHQEERAKFTIEISFFEIYNEKIHDLLASSKGTDKDVGKKRAALKVREHPVQGPYVEGLSMFVANSYGDIHSWIELGNKQRATAATGMNDKSSRSHSVFTIVMTKTKAELIEGDEHTHNVTSRINLVDLAGSERCSSAQTTGDRLKEGANINCSLMTLGKVISQLAEKSMNRRKKFFIPYRDSILTWLLKESLGGNAKTAMIATISPSSLHVDETLSTLHYAKQARSIINIAKVNEDPNARLIRELRSEIARLRGQGFTTPTRSHQPSQNTPKDLEKIAHTEAIKESLAEIAELRRKLAESEHHMKEAEGSWKQRLKESEMRRVNEVGEMEKSGVTFKIDNTLPNLVNLNEDPQLSEVLLYVLREGQTRLGKTDGHSCHQIQLSGALVEDDHCIITNKEGAVTVRPVGDAQTFINGSLISSRQTLKHGDRVVIGDHYFRFNHPQQVHDGSRSCESSVGAVDFEFARNELVAAQSANRELSKMEYFQRQQKGIEDENLCKKKLLSKAIADRKKKTQEESKHLVYIQKELSNIEKFIPNDVNILRDKIEEASRHCSEAQKRYQKAEAEFVTAKISLHKASDHKEALTEHLCTIIRENELSSSKKLEELVEKLDVDNLAAFEAETDPLKPEAQPRLSSSSVGDTSENVRGTSSAGEASGEAPAPANPTIPPASHTEV